MLERAIRFGWSVLTDVAAAVSNLSNVEFFAALGMVLFALTALTATRFLAHGSPRADRERQRNLNHAA